MTVLIGLDYGERRVGIAVTDPSGKLALAAGTHVEGRDGSVIAKLRDLIREHGAVGLVVGLPLTADGRETGMAERTRRFVKILARELSLPVSLHDERYTSKEAAGWIALRGRPARRGEVDAVAAQIILQNYIDRLASTGRPPQEGEPSDGSTGGSEPPGRPEEDPQ